jgi:hypothetical protein
MATKVAFGRTIFSSQFDEMEYRDTDCFLQQQHAAAGPVSRDRAEHNSAATASADLRRANAFTLQGKQQEERQPTELRIGPP